jgi:TolA-binding protein
LAICNLVSLLALAPSLRADTIYISSTGTGSGVPLPNASVQGVTDDDQLSYLVSGNTPKTRPISQVMRIQLDSDPVFNAAEEAYAAGKWDDAVDGYVKILHATNKEWMKDWATLRLMDAAQQSKRFDASCSAYIAMLLRKPQATTKPTLPAAGSTFLDGAISEANAALATRDINDHQKLALLNFLLDLYGAKKDTSGQDRIKGQIDDILAKDPSNPAAGQAIARRQLLSAQRALDAKDYAKALSEIDAGKTNIVDPPQQADALFIIAQARFGMASAKQDPTELKDAALAYMRVVANFKDLPNHPHAPESLLKTAQIEEQLNDPAVANQLYQQIAQQYPQDPLAAVAKQKLQK